MLLLLALWIILFQVTAMTTPNEDFCTTNAKVINNNTDSDYVIGGLFPIHFIADSKYEINRPGLLWSLALVFAIDEINRSEKLLAGVTLGYEIYDTCSTTIIATDATLRLTNINTPQNNTNNTGCVCDKDSRSVIAVIGDAYSVTSTRIASITSALRTTQISYGATSIELSSKQLYPTFLRTIPPDSYQAFAIAELMAQFHWDYVNVIACDDSYGRVGSNALLQLLTKNGICVSVKALYDIKNDKDGVITSQVVKRLIKEEQATVIILWCLRPEALKVVRKAEELKLYQRTWVATETFATADELLKINPNVIKGMIGVRISQIPYTPFETFLREQKPSIKTNNPWLNKYWEIKGCKLSGNRYQCLDNNINLSDLPKNEYVNVFHSAYAIAVGLENYLANNKFKNHTAVEKEVLFQFIKNVKFTGKDNFTVSFNEDGDPGVVMYTIVNIKINSTTKESYFQNIGTFDGKSLKMESTDYIEFSTAPYVPASTCKEYCHPGFSKVIFGSRPCCWKCIKCPKNTVQPSYDQNKCFSCQDDFMSNQNQTICLKPDLEYFHFNDPLNLVLVILSLLSSIVILSSIIVIIKYKETPVVKALNFKLSLLQLFSIFILIGLPVMSFSFKQDSTTCRIQLCYFIFFYVIAISVTFTKADVLLRIFKASKSGILSKRNRIRNTKIEYINVTCLTIVGLVFCSILFFTFKFSSEKSIVNMKAESITVYYHCGGYYDTTLLSLLAYLGVIGLICGVYAFKARKLPASYNEGKYTSFSMFIFILTWLTFIPLYFSTDSHFTKHIIWCYVSLITNVSVFTLMYVPKLLIIIFRPSQNTRETFRKKISQAKPQHSNLFIVTRSTSTSCRESSGSTNEDHLNSLSLHNISCAKESSVSNMTDGNVFCGKDTSHRVVSRQNSSAKEKIDNRT